MTQFIVESGKNSVELLFVAVMACFALAISGAGTGAYADTIVGNLDVQSFTVTHSSGGGCGNPFTESTISSNPLNPGFELTASPVCELTATTGGTGTADLSLVLHLAGLNGYTIGDLSFSTACGIVGGTASWNIDPGLAGDSPLSVPCDTQSSPGTTVSESGEISFTPVSALTETITVNGTIETGGTVSIASIANQFSLVAPTAVPEGGSFLAYFSLSLLGLFGFARRWRRA
jgi:hypothetical protein